MALDLESRTGRVGVRYRGADGGFVETTLDRVVVDEVAGGLPVREFRWYKGRRHYSGWYWSATVERLVVYESRLELARIVLADQDPGVTAIAAQPFQMIGEDHGRLRRHVPDLLLVDGSGGVTVVDVKAASRLDDPAVVEQFAWTGELIGSRGWRFEVWSGADRQVLDNVRFLAGYRRPSTIDTGLTIRRRRKNLGIAAGPTGVHRLQIRRHPDLPDAIRRAVEGQRHGWQRLRRFQQITGFHSMNTAAQALGYHTSNLNLQIQRLETDIGAQLLHRGHRYQQMTLTRAGYQLLEHLNQRHARDLLDRYTKPTGGPTSLGVKPNKLGSWRCTGAATAARW